MAINDKPVFTAGQKLTPEQIAKLKAGEYTGKFAPGVDFRVNQVQRGTSVGADAEFMDDPTGAGTTLYYQARNASNFGGNDVTDVWDQEGNYLGTSSGMGDLRGLATIAAMAVGGAYMNGGFGTGTAGGAGGTAGASGIANASNGAFLGEGVSSGVGAWDAAAIKSAALSGELGTAASYVGQNLSNGTMFDTARSLAGDTLSNLSDANSVKNASDAANSGNKGGSNSMNWLDVINTAAGIYGMAQAGQNSSDATAAMQNVANGQMALNQEALDWYKQVYADQAPARDAAAQRANAISDSLLTGMNFANTQAQELDQYNKTTFRPIEQRMVADATDYNTAERRETAANDATGQVATSYDIQRQQAQRDMERAGVDPSTIYALGVSSRLDEAKAQAGAANTARTGVEQQGWSRMADVANMGRGIASQQATQQGIATTTGNSSTSNAMQGLNATQSGNNLMSQGYQNATQGNQVTGNLFNQVANAQRQDDQMLIGGIGNIARYAGNRYGT